MLLAPKHASFAGTLYTTSFPPYLLLRLKLESMGPTSTHQSSGHAPVASMWAPVGLPSNNVPGQVVMQPSANDIILGRGVPISKYEGNIRFRELIREYRGEYMATGRHHRKQEIVQEVVEKIRERNCRFLSRTETDEEAQKYGLPAGSRAWYIASEEVALSKVKQALREMESSTSPRTLKSPARSDSSSRRSRKKKPPAREEATNGEGVRSLADPAPPARSVVAAPAVAAVASLPTTTAAPPQPALTMLLSLQQSQHGWNPALWPTTGLSQATTMNTLPGQQSFAALVQPPSLYQPMGSLQQQSYLAALTGTPLSFANTSLTNPSGSVAQWLEQQRNSAQERINQHFDGLLQEHMLQQQQRQVALWRHQLEAQLSQQANAQALYLSQLGTATSNVTRGALLSVTGLHHTPFSLGNTMSQLGAVGTVAGAQLGVASDGSVGNPTQEGNGLAAAVHNDTESLVEALSGRHGEAAAVSTDNQNKEGREQRRSEVDNHGAAATRAEGTLTPSERLARRRRRQEMDDCKPRARPQGSAAQTNNSDKSEAVSNSSTSSSTSATSK
jgi:hypothetical protein